MKSQLKKKKKKKEKQTEIWIPQSTQNRIAQTYKTMKFLDDNDLLEEHQLWAHLGFLVFTFSFGNF